MIYKEKIDQNYNYQPLFADSKKEKSKKKDSGPSKTSQKSKKNITDEIGNIASEKKDLGQDVSLTENQKIFNYIKQYVAGQDSSIRSLIAIYSQCQMRNKVEDENLRNSIKPPHAIFHGPTGCGKSYMISKLSEHLKIPFIKTEATQYTEVGYVGKDVETMVKDLVEKSIQIIKKKHIEAAKDDIKKNVYKEILEIILGSEITEETFKIFSEKLEKGELDEKEIEIEVSEDSASFATIDVPGGGSSGTQIGMMNFGDMIGKILGKKNTKKMHTNVKNALEKLTEEESEKFIDEAAIIKEAIEFAEKQGIIFIDEIDKIATNSNTASSSRGDVSKEGVQRDLLPLLDGTTLTTKYGRVKTDHMLFIAAGAFHMSKFSDLMPELQGRFPMHIKLHTLNEGHFFEILNNKKNSLIAQYQVMMKTESVDLEFNQDAIKFIAKTASKMNRDIENTGARRLRTIVDNIMEDLNFESEKYFEQKFIIDELYVKSKVEALMTDLDLERFVL